MLGILLADHSHTKYRLYYLIVMLFALVFIDITPVCSKSSRIDCAIDRLTPTVFFKSESSLMQIADLSLYVEKPVHDLKVVIRADHQQCHTEIDSLTSGANSIRVTVPVLEERGRLQISVYDQNDNLFGRKAVAWSPQRKWTVYLIHGSHHDLGYTDIQANILRFHRSHMDSVLRFCERTANWPLESRFKYTVEQAWSVLDYIENRPPEKIEQLKSYLRQGRIEVTALLGNEITELCSHEELIRLLYPAFRLKQRFGIDIQSAELNDMPGMAWGLVSVLKGAGVSYFAPAIQDYFAWGGLKASYVWDEDEVLPRNRPGAFWWQGPDKSKILFWFGGPTIETLKMWTFESTVTELAKYLEKLQANDYAFDLTRIKFHGGLGDNSQPDIRLSQIAREWNRQWAFPKLIVATNSDFFKVFEHKAGNQLKTIRGNLPHTDYHIGALSTAKETGLNRQTHYTATACEIFSSFASLVSDYRYPVENIARVYDHMLMYDEHCWGIHSPVGPAQQASLSQKRLFAYNAAAYAHDTLVKSTNKIADEIELNDPGYHIVVFNSLAHKRTGLVTAPASPASPAGFLPYWEYPLEYPSRPATSRRGGAVGRKIIKLPLDILEAPFDLIDLETLEVVPCQVFRLDDPHAALPHAPERWALGHTSEKRVVTPNNKLYDLLFIARDVPALGYKTYRIIPRHESDQALEYSDPRTHYLENQFYKIEIDSSTGAVSSIFDKETDRELVDQAADYCVNQCIVRSPQDGRIVSTLDEPEIVRGKTGPVATSLVIKNRVPGCPQLTQEIILYEEIKRIDFNNRVLKDATPLQKVCFAFPFSLDNPHFRYQAPLAIIEPIVDQIPGSHTENFTLQEWAAVYNEKTCLLFNSVEAPVVSFSELGPGRLSQAHHAITPPGYVENSLKQPKVLTNAHIYSLVMANNFKTNFNSSQVSDALFTYSLSSVKSFESKAAVRFGNEVSNPLIPVFITGKQNGSLPVAESFCRLDNPDVTVLTIKAAQDGQGLILRLAEQSGHATQVNIELPLFELEKAFLCNLSEDNMTSLTVIKGSISVNMKAHTISTIRCIGKKTFPVLDHVVYFN
jgi:hypothetical protein